MGYLLKIAGCLFLFLTAAHGADTLEDSSMFREYPVSTFYAGGAAPIDFDNHSELKRFRTRLNQGIQKGPNFSGKYRVVEWGCGTSCSQVVIVDVETGKIRASATACGGSRFQLDSRLLILDPGLAEGDLYAPIGCETKFYLFENDQLQALDVSRKVEE